jgi:hypothetical protein
MVDEHTLRTNAAGLTYILIPPGIGANYARLMTVEIPQCTAMGTL